MADATAAHIAAACADLNVASIPDSALEDARVRLLDTLGCASGGWSSPPARVAQHLARQESSLRAARVWGTDITTTVESAAFANSVATRYLDYNDTYMGVSAGHPSDMIPALLALAEAHGSNGAELLLSIVTSYEAFGVIAKQVALRDRGWDQGVLVGMGTAMGAAKLLDLDGSRTEHALSLVTTMATPTLASRAGELSMWKGAATAAAAKLGLFSALLASEGMTGPDRPFEGKNGLWSNVTGPFDVRPFGAPDGWMVSNTAVKFLPAEFTAQAPLELVADVCRGVDLETIEQLDVWTYWMSFDEIGNEPAKWNPQSRETADHSLPYLLAVYLRDGRLGTDSFDDAHLQDPSTRHLMAKIRIHEDKSYTARFPELLTNRLRVTLSSGQIIEAEIDFPAGHPRRHPTSARVEEKFLDLAVEGMGERRALAVLSAVSALPQAPEVTSLVDSLASSGS